MKQNKQKNLKRGFTLIEMLVVVLIIGILASVALPQYQMAVTKAKVASILPIMRRFKDALTEYKLQHGNYDVHDYDTLGVSWPTNNDYWDECIANELGDEGCIYCSRDTNDGVFSIDMFTSDYSACEICRDKIMCLADGEEANKICKALGGKIVEDTGFEWEYTYIL